MKNKPGASMELVSLEGQAERESGQEQGEFLPPILRIPRELRLQIYGYLIPRTSNVQRFYPEAYRGPNTPKYAHVLWDYFRSYTDIDHYAGERATDIDGARRDLTIIRTCRQIHFEVLGLIYSRSLFHFIGFTYSPVVEFMRRLSPIARYQITQVRLTLLNQPPEVERECHELFCNYVSEELPALDCLTADPWIWTT